MSLVSTYVIADDGLYYRDPVLEGDGWFICFDDDDPPELVIRCFQYNDPQMLLKAHKLPFIVTGSNGKALRCFNGSVRNMHDAKAYWLEMKAPIPVEYLRRDGKQGIKRENIKTDCVVYDDPRE